MAYQILSFATSPFTQQRTYTILCDTSADLPATVDGYSVGQGWTAKVIEDGSSYIANAAGSWILQPSNNAFYNVYTKAEIDNMIAEIDNIITAVYQTIMYYHTTQTSTDGTITFYAFAGDVKSLSIYGNGSQTGTPTPDNPVMPEFVGVRTEQLFDASTLENGIYLAANGNKYGGATVGVRSGTKIKVLPNTTYTLSAQSSANVSLRILEWASGTFTKQFAKYDISGSVSLTVTTTAETTEIAFNIEGENGQYATNIMLNSGSTALPYEPFGYKIPITCAGQTTPVYLGELSTDRKIKKMILDGTETVTEESANVYSVPIADTVIPDAGVSTHFVYDGAADDGQFRIEAGKAVFGYDDTQANFTAFLAAQYAAGTPVTVWYVLATQTTGIVNEPLAKIGDYCDELHITDDEVTIPTINGSNTLTVDTDLPPSLIEISGGN